jgi:glycosyltransferase involved in cell wall biosynthesis
MREDPVSFVLVGNGHERERLATRIQTEGLSNVYMFPPVPKAHVPIFLKQIQAAYLGAPRQPIYRFGVSPNKMFDYMMAGVPILYAIEAGNDLVTEADCGLSIPSEDARALAAAIRELRASTPERLLSMGNNGRHYALANHSYDVLANNFINAMKSTPSKT